MLRRRSLSFPDHGRVTFVLPLQADEEAEDLFVVGVGFDDGEGEVEGDRGRAHRRDGDPQAEAGGDAEVVRASTLGVTVPKSQNTTPCIMSSAVSGNRYSSVLSHSNSPPTCTPCSTGDAPRKSKPRSVEKPPAKKFS